MSTYVADNCSSSPGTDSPLCPDDVNNGTRRPAAVLNVTFDDSDDFPLGNIKNIYGLRFGPYTAVSVACLLINIVSLLAMAHIRGRRTVHHMLLINLAVCDMCGSVLLWMYYNSPYLFPHFELTSYRHCLFILLVILGNIVVVHVC